MTKSLFAAAVFALAGTALADDVVWNFNNKAVAKGSGCSSQGATPDTYFVTAGPEVSVVFSRLGVNLASDMDPMAARQECAVRIPVKIAKGRYIGKLVQTLLFGVSKSPGAAGSVAMRATFFNEPAAVVSESFARGAQVDEPLREVRKVNKYRVTRDDPRCKNPGVKGLYAFNMAVSGSRDNPQESVVMQIDGADIKFTATAQIHECEL